ncbi:hypothetical protein [Enhygromyxa salina]|uniref:hypothetical protein n=1 Tax=Enhygromyxa salina TaxID=215803 RepID=UPI000D087D34|nr:hypothetical protein [Enhygromyxa salina]
MSLCGLTLLASGCPDPEARFNEFLEASEDHRLDAGEGEGDGDGDGDTGVEGIPDMNGTYLFAVETNLGPDLPMQFSTTISNMVIAEDGSGATADFSFQPLSLDQGETLTPRECVGEPLNYEGVEFDADGNYEIDMGLVKVTGAANPITGSDIEATLVTTGRIVHSNALCGDVAGMVTVPLEAPLEPGSFFGALRIDDDGCDPATLPTTFPYRCEMVPPADSPDLPDVTGNFLFAVETNLGPDLPMQFATTVTFTASADGLGGVADFSFQPLSLDQGEILTPREFVGDPLVFDDIPIAADGSFEVDMGLVKVTGAANPITGSDIEATLLISGEVLDMDTMCGDVAGMVTVPLEAPLEPGSFFAASRLADDGSDPSTLPTDFPYKCSQI